MPPPELPDDVRRAFLRILRDTLINIRWSGNTELADTLANHAHNIPDLLTDFTPPLLRYYQETERPCFIYQMDRLGRSPGLFLESWLVIGIFYRSLRRPSGE